MKTKNKANTILVLKTLLIMPSFLLMSFGISSRSNCQNSEENKTEQFSDKKPYDFDITKDYYGVKTVDISTVSGNCEIIRGEDSIVKVSLTHHYKPAKTFEPIFEQQGDVLKLKEKMLGSNSGSSDWIIWVPEQTNILFESSSGSISIKDIKAKIIVHTSSGDVKASNIQISESSEFISASGFVSVKFSDSPKFNVLVSSASGNALIDLSNKPVTGTIEMKARTENGAIVSPFKFDNETEEFVGNQSYMTKSIVQGKESPIIRIYTGSGKAILVNIGQN